MSLEIPRIEKKVLYSSENSLKINVEESEAGMDEEPEEGDGRVGRSDVEVEGLCFLLRQHPLPVLGNLIIHLIILHLRIGEDKMVPLKNKKIH